MEIRNNVTVDARKALVTAMGELGLQEFHQRRAADE